MPTNLAHATAIAFDFEDLFRSSDDTLLKRFGVMRAVRPGLVPADFRPDACRIRRDADAITIEFIRRENADDPGAEVFRFSFQPAKSSS